MVRVVAHRGGARHAPENTLAAIRWSLDQRVDGIEIDVRLSADKVPMVIHDRSVDRCTNGSGLVSSLDARQLSSLDAGSWFGREFDREPIPKLDEVLSVVSGRTELYVEVKGGEEEHPGITAEVLKVIRHHNATSWCWLMSFHPSSLVAARAIEPSLRLARLIIARIPFTPIVIDPVFHLRWRPGFPGVRAVALNHLGATTREVARLHKQQLEVWTWTPNGPNTIRRAVGTGADVLITDDPPLARAELRRLSPEAGTSGAAI
ncbi:MAG: hypothetical protein H6682_22480 [Candidatus Eisenbacteria bacterium]|nr:hypothetical protein [Candidatus Eisenbacteria bacterium]